MGDTEQPPGGRRWRLQVEAAGGGCGGADMQL